MIQIFKVSYHFHIIHIKIYIFTNCDIHSDKNYKLANQMMMMTQNIYKINHLKLFGITMRKRDYILM